jgi:hypothetical protein
MGESIFPGYRSLDVRRRLSLPADERWAIAFHRASMILSGIGPVESDEKNLTDFERYFVGAYAIFSGFVLVTVIGLILTPIFHRVLHHFHIDDEKASRRRRVKSKRTRIDSARHRS